MTSHILEIMFPKYTVLSNHAVLSQVASSCATMLNCTVSLCPSIYIFAWLLPVDFQTTQINICWLYLLSGAE